MAVLKNRTKRENFLVVSKIFLQDTRLSLTERGFIADGYLVPKSYPITYNLYGGVNSPENPVSYTVEDGDIVLKAPTHENAEFVGWYADSSFSSKIDKIETKQMKEITVYARWKAVKIPKEQPSEQTTDVTVSLGGKVVDTASKASYVIKSMYGSKEVEYASPVSSIPNNSGIVIPATVPINGVNYKVTSIAAKAFKNNKKINFISIGANVESIGAEAFSGCTKLKEIIIPKKTKSIGNKAFYRCTALTKITISKGITSIGKSAFEGCSKLKTITVKTTSLGKVGKNAIKGINKKAVIKVPKKQLKKYQKLFCKKNVGYKKSMKVKK